MKRLSTLALCLVLSACVGIGPGSTVGTWVSDRGATFTFYEDKTFEYEDFAPGDRLSEAGECVLPDFRYSGVGTWRQGSASSEVLLSGLDANGDFAFLLPFEHSGSNKLVFYACDFDEYVVETFTRAAE